MGVDIRQHAKILFLTDFPETNEADGVNGYNSRLQGGGVEVVVAQKFTYFPTTGFSKQKCSALPAPAPSFTELPDEPHP